jgi:hypothetical protein
LIFDRTFGIIRPLHEPRQGPILTEAQVVALEKAKTEKKAHGPSSRANAPAGAQDNFYVGNVRGVGRIYQL